MDRYIKMNGILSLFCKNYMDLKKNLPIRPSEMGVVNIISEGEGKFTSIELAKMLLVSKPMITAHISSLIEKGYVTTEQSLDDKRVFYIIPTTKALDLVERTKNDLNKTLEEFIKNIGEEEFANFVSVADLVNKILATKG